MPFELTILGSSSALPRSDRYPSAQVLSVPGRFFLIDCGEGTQLQLRSTTLKQLLNTSTAETLKLEETLRVHL